MPLKTAAQIGKLLVLYSCTMQAFPFPDPNLVFGDIMTLGLANSQKSDWMKRSQRPLHPLHASSQVDISIKHTQFANEDKTFSHHSFRLCKYNLLSAYNAVVLCSIISSNLKTTTKKRWIIREEVPAAQSRVLAGGWCSRSNSQNQNHRYVLLPQQSCSHAGLQSFCYDISLHWY